MALRDKLRIPVVDDMSTSRGLITRALDGLGMGNISAAVDGPGALHALKKKPVHLVISDYNMPRMNGLRLLAWVRRQPKTQEIGFILVTRRADQRIVDEGRKLGLNTFLQKLFDPIDLRKCIETMLGTM